MGVAFGRCVARICIELEGFLKVVPLHIYIYDLADVGYIKYKLHKRRAIS